MCHRGTPDADVEDAFVGVTLTWLVAMQSRFDGAIGLVVRVLDACWSYRLEVQPTQPQGEDKLKQV
jgi:hypothetical protein